MTINNQSALRGSLASATPNADSSARSNSMQFNGGGGTNSSGEHFTCDSGEEFYREAVDGNMNAWIGTRPTSAIQYTTGQLEYAKTCLKKSLEVEGYSIDNEFEEEHTITVDDINSSSENSFDAAEHSGVVLSDPNCGKGLKFILNMDDFGKGVFEVLWNVPAGANQFDYFSGLGLMELICQEDIPSVPQLADHGCIMQYLTDFDYWYQLSEEVFVEDPAGPDSKVVGGDIVNGFLYPKNSYIKVMPNGEFEGKFEFENEEDVPIKECDEFYVIKDVVKLDVNGIWVEEIPDEGPINGGDTTTPSDEDKKCVIEHGDGDSYTITAISDQEPVTHSYDYGDVATSDLMEMSAIPPLYYPENHLQFLPVWDEVYFVEGMVPFYTDADGNVSCPWPETEDKSVVNTVLYHSKQPSIDADKIWHIDHWNSVPCSTIIDESSSAAEGIYNNCGFFTAQMLNFRSGESTGPHNLTAEYFKSASGAIGKSSYPAYISAPDGENPKIDNEIVKIPVVIDCWDKWSLPGQPNFDEPIPIDYPGDLANCKHCDCHKIHPGGITIDVGCDPCEKCGNGNGPVKKNEDYFHIQNNCPEELEISQQCSGTHNGGHGCSNEDFLSILNNLELTENQEFRWEVNYAYRTDDNATAWDHGYGRGNSNKAEYAEKDTFKCIITYSGGCVDGMDFMKKTPELSGSSDLTATYRRIVSADEFNKCGDDRLPSLSYSDMDLVKVEGFGGYLDFFPKAALAHRVELTAIEGGLASYDLSYGDEIRVKDMLGKIINFERIVHKTKVESHDEFCGMGAKFREERRQQSYRDLSSVEPPAPNYKVNCKAENYRPHLYADKYDVVVDYDKILKEFDDLLTELGLDPEVDGNKILMSHHYGPGTVCKEEVRQAIRVPAIGNQKITSGYDNWGYFGRRWVGASTPGNPNDPNAGECNGMGTATFQLDCGGSGLESGDGCCTVYNREGGKLTWSYRPGITYQWCKDKIGDNIIGVGIVTDICWIPQTEGPCNESPSEEDCYDSDDENIKWTLRDQGACSNPCVPDAPVGADDSQIAQCKRYNDGDGDPVQKDVPCKDDADVCGIAIYKLVNDGGKKCEGKVTVWLESINPVIWSFDEQETERRGYKPCPDGCEPDFPTVADNDDRVMFEDGLIVYRDVACAGGKDPKWYWDLETPCLEGCSALPPGDITQVQIEKAAGHEVKVEVKCFKSGGPQEDQAACLQKYEDKPVPAPYSSVDGRTCDENLLGAYAEKLIGYTKEDADRNNVLLDNLVKPILPSELGVALDQNRPPFKIVVNKSLYSLQEYRFTIGDN